jgi:hypothetical protein|tara:strand:- start:57 stop:245 length:189 start_codon:yes stop_codon:yes gene_type:complete
MPKKKLTKAQVKKKYNTAFNALYDLFLDKISHPDSFNPVSKKKADEMLDSVFRARRTLANRK